MKIGCAIIFLLMLSGCQEVWLGKETPDNPEHIFDLLWDDLDKHYALFYAKGTNWDSLYHVYRAQITSESTDGQLWQVMSELLETLNDSHTVLYQENDLFAYTSGNALNQKAIDDEFSLFLVKRSYVPDLREVPTEADLHFGKIKDRKIGYILIREEFGDDPAGAITSILDELTKCKAIILDLRTNDGGDKRYSKVIAGAFSDGEHLVGTSQTRNGPNHDDFDAKTEERSQRTGPRQFHRPVIVLTDRATISGGEYLTLHMRTFSNVTQIGDTTAGDFSAVSTRSFLPNGWSYQYSIQMFLLPDGRSLDGVGIAPDIYVKNSKATIDASEDIVLEKALNFLSDKYGID